jgi:hypothetical protein
LPFRTLDNFSLKMARIAPQRQTRAKKTPTKDVSSPEKPPTPVCSSQNCKSRSNEIKHNELAHCNVCAKKVNYHRRCLDKFDRGDKQMLLCQKHARLVADLHKENVNGHSNEVSIKRSDNVQR